MSQQTMHQMLTTESEERTHSLMLLSEHQVAEEGLRKRVSEERSRAEAAQEQSAEQTKTAEKLKQLLVDQETRDEELLNHREAEHLAREQDVIETLEAKHASVVSAMSDKMAHGNEQVQHLTSELRAERHAECEMARQCVEARQSADEIAEQLANARSSSKEELENKSDMNGKSSQQALEDKLAKESVERARSAKLLSEYRDAEVELKKHVANLKEELHEEKAKNANKDVSRLEDILSQSQNASKKAREDVSKLEVKLKAQQQLVEKTKKESAARIATLDRRLSNAQVAVAVPPQNRKRKFKPELENDEIMMRESFWAKKERSNATRSAARPHVQRVQRWVGPGSEICWDFRKRGVCPRGARCTWRHPSNVPFIPVAVKEEPDDD